MRNESTVYQEVWKKKEFSLKLNKRKDVFPHHSHSAQCLSFSQYSNSRKGKDIQLEKKRSLFTDDMIDYGKFQWIYEKAPRTMKWVQQGHRIHDTNLKLCMFYYHSSENCEHQKNSKMQCFLQLLKIKL